AVDEGRIDEHALSWRPAADTGTGRVDVAHAVAAGDARQLDADARQAAAAEDVEVVERAGAHAHAHLARSGRRVREVAVAQHLRTAVLLEEDGLHLIDSARQARATFARLRLAARRLRRLAPGPFRRTVARTRRRRRRARGLCW